MTHLVRSPGWAEIDLDLTAGRVFVQQRWKYEWTVVPPARAWTYAERRAFHHTLDTQVWGLWSNRILLRTNGTHDLCRTHPRVEVEFDVRWVLNDPHWQVDVRKMPPGSNPTTFISNVEPDQRRIHLDTADVDAYRPQNAAGQRRPFRALPHEFGHTMDNPDEYGARSPHLVDTDSVMNIGRLVRERHVHALIVELNRMVPDCTFSFGGQAVRRSSRGTKAPKAAPPPPPASTNEPPPSSVKMTWYELKVLDEVGDPVDGIDISFSIGGEKRKVTTNGAGIARVDDVTSSFGSAQLVSVAAVRKKMEPKWKEARERNIEAGEDVFVRVLRKGVDVDSASLESETPAKLVIVPPSDVRRVRLVGMHFDTDKSFLLPTAMHGIRRIKTMYDRAPGGSVLVVGHTDTQGSSDHNMTLSVERADAIGAYLTDDVDAWMAWFGQGKPASKRWGTREIQHMLTALPEDPADGPKFYGKKPNGAKDSTHLEAVKRFQQWSNDKKGTSLAVDGDAGPATRPEIVKAYMALDGTTLPDDAKLVTHGCGEGHPEVKTGDGVANDQNRRVELFVFEGPIDPPPPGKTSQPSDPQYDEWKKKLVETVDVSGDTPGEDDLGILFMEIFDKAGVKPLAGKSYQIVPSDPENKTFTGTVGEDGRLRHEGVHPDDYVLSVDGMEETTAALVLDKTSADPQVRFLS
jgi:outer membrane protein OmpA-like peptidoglycan-associated protein